MIIVADNEFTSEDNDFKMGEVEYEIVELLRKLNISRPVALTLACLSKGEEISSQCIEMVSGLRQPEVSIAMRYLRENDWVDMREEKKNQGKQRNIIYFVSGVKSSQLRIDRALKLINNLKALKEGKETMREIFYGN